MLKQKAKLVAFSVYLTEIILLIAAFLATFEVRDLYFSETYGHLVPFEQYLWLIYIILSLWSCFLYLCRSCDPDSVQAWSPVFVKLKKRVLF